jgi:hypothetical protein
MLASLLYPVVVFLNSSPPKTHTTTWFGKIGKTVFPLGNAEFDSLKNWVFKL